MNIHTPIFSIVINSIGLTFFIFFTKNYAKGFKRFLYGYNYKEHYIDYICTAAICAILFFNVCNSFCIFLFDITISEYCIPVFGLLFLPFVINWLKEDD